MQLVDEKNIEKRIVFYLSKMYTQNLKKAHNYSELNKCISILFIDFELEKLKEIPKYLTKWNIREENYGKIILTEVLEFYIIDMSKILTIFRQSTKICGMLCMKSKNFLVFFIHNSHFFPSL